jgi:ferric-dicitrate binding protein FerR (iron transport regulator)
MRTAKLSLLLAVAGSVCLAQYPYVPTGSGAYSARVVTATGQVSILKHSDFIDVGVRRTNANLLSLSAGDQVQVTQTIVTGPDGHATLQVSDGSTIEVFPNSQMVFRKNTGDWKDLLDLLIGKIRVHIEHLGNNPNPNRIMTPTAVISVRGTTFEVSVEEAEETTQVDVVEGTVVVDHALLPTGQIATLHTGDSIRVYKSVPIGSHQLDKSTIARYVFNIVRDAVLTLTSHGTGKITLPGGSGGGGGVLGDTCKPGTAGCGGAAPPAPPPPPPPIN